MDQELFALSEVVSDLPESLLWQFFNLTCSMDNVISLSVGEPDFKTPDHIGVAGMSAIYDEKTCLEQSFGNDVLRERIVSFYRDVHGVSGYTKDNVIVTHGASEAIDLICRCVLNEGDECIVLDPGYIAYEPLVHLNRAKPVFLQLKEEDQFKVTVENLKACISDKTKMILLNYPNNPTGGVMNEEDYRKILPLLKEHNILIVQDEIYLELTFDHKPTSIGIFEEIQDQLVIINGFSKSYSMTGWRIGYAMAPKYLIDAMNRIHQYSLKAVTSMSQFAAMEALNARGVSDICMHRESFLKRRDYVVDRLNGMGLKTNRPEGAFYVFANIQCTNLSSYEFCTKLLEEKRVCVIPGSSFGKSGEGFIRMSYAYSLEQLELGLNLLEEFLSELKKV